MSMLWWTLKCSTHGSSVVKNSTQSSITNVATEQWNTANGDMCGSAQPILQIQLIMLARVVSSVYREDLAGQRKCCTNTWLVSSRLSNYSHRCYYMGIPFGDQDGRINRSKAVNLSNTALSYESAQWPWTREEQHWGKGNPAITASATVAPASCYLLLYSLILVSTYFRCLLSCVGLLAGCICTTPCIGSMPLYKQVCWVYTLLMLYKGTVRIGDGLSLSTSPFLLARLLCSAFKVHFWSQNSASSHAWMQQSRLLT